MGREALPNPNFYNENVPGMSMNNKDQEWTSADSASGYTVSDGSVDSNGMLIVNVYLTCTGESPYLLVFKRLESLCHANLIFL